jgi:Domain of unknown function (DUF4157)
MPDREFDPTAGPVSRLPQRNANRTEQTENSGAPVAERDPVDRVACRAGDDSCAKAHASALNRSTDSQPARASRSLLQLQRQYGNRYVERVVALARENLDRKNAEPNNNVSPDVELAIQQERGGGQALDHGVRRQMESSFGANFSGVRVHTDAQSDSLNRALSARAFTTGQDIFFRGGAYQPAHSSGRELIAHELTHVVQQGGDQVRRAMSVSQPNDPHEVEAEQTARAVMEQEHVGHEAHGEKEKEKEKEAEHHEHHMMASRCPCDEAKRQPEAAHGKDKEEEEKKKHHVATALDGSRVSRQEEPEQER